MLVERPPEQLGLSENYLASVDEIGQRAQLAIVIGGDGNVLGRARTLAKYDIALIGINRGNLGFSHGYRPEKCLFTTASLFRRRGLFCRRTFHFRSQCRTKWKNHCARKCSQ